MNKLTAADRRHLNAAFAKEINGLVSKWSRDNSGNMWEADARAAAEGALLKLMVAGEIAPDSAGEYASEQRKRAYNAMRHTVYAELLPLTKQLSASVNTHAAYRKARLAFEKARPDDDFTAASVNTIVDTLGCSPCFAFRAKISQQPRANTDNPDSPAAHLADESFIHPAAKIVDEERHLALRRALTLVPKPKQALLVRLFGLDGRDEQTLAEIARDMGITRQALAEQLERVFSHLRPELAPYALAA